MNALATSDRIFLRKLAKADATPAYCSWLNDPEVNKYLETKSASIEELREYIQSKNKDPNCLFVGIFDKTNGSHIGNMKFEPIDWGKGTAVFGIMIGDKNYWGKGFGTEATKLFVAYAFEKLGISSISLGVFADNAGAVKAYENAGFKACRKHKNEIEMIIQKRKNDEK